MGRAGVAMALVAALLTGVGCGEDECPDRPEEVLVERSVAVAHRSADLAGEVGAEQASFVVSVLNSEGSVERVRLAVDGRPALDVDLPAAQDCWAGHGPIFTFAYDLPPGPAVVALDIQGSTSETSVDVPAAGSVWGVVDVQSQRAWGDLQLYDEPPQFG